MTLPVKKIKVGFKVQFDWIARWLRKEKPMPDISMCQRSDCPRKESCYRFKAKPSEMGQSYLVIDDPENCDYYWPMEPEPTR